MNYEILFDPDFDEYAWEVEVKGWFDISVKLDARVTSILFYDPVRLAQSVADDIAERGIFFERNIIVVPKVTRINIEKAIEHLNTSGALLAWQ